jgi:hypothetical protein
LIGAQRIIRFKANITPFLAFQGDDNAAAVLEQFPRFDYAFAFELSRQREPRGCVAADIA